MDEDVKKFFGDKPKLPAKSKRVLGILLGGICLFALFLFFIQSPKKHAARPDAESGEKDLKGLYSRAEIESLIKEKTMEEMEKKEVRKPQETVPGQKRKLNSQIAVFIKDEGKQNTGEVAQQKDQRLNIPTGEKIKAHLANAIFSFNVSSPVVAITDEDVKKDAVVIIPKNTKFVGDAGIVKSRDRVNIKFSTMILPDGRELKVRAMGLGLDGSGGIKGRVDKQYDKSLLRAAGETALAGAAIVLGTRERALTLGDELRLNAARNLTDDAHEALNNVKIEESITVEAYTPILVLFLESV